MMFANTLNALIAVPFLHGRCGQSARFTFWK